MRDFLSLPHSSPEELLEHLRKTYGMHFLARFAPYSVALLHGPMSRLVIIDRDGDALSSGPATREVLHTACEMLNTHCANIIMTTEEIEDPFMLY